MTFKLGKKAARHDKRTLRLAKYLGSKLPTPPASCDWASKVGAEWGMMLNDQLGDCTCAAAGHMIMQWTKYVGAEAVLPDSTIESTYETVGGYVPGDPSTDNGCVMLDVLKYWKNTGVGGHRIFAFASLEPRNHRELMDSIYLFGNAYIGVALPNSVQNADGSFATSWTVPSGGPVGDNAPGTLGGHCIPVVEYDARGLTVISWGAPLRMSWNFYDDYCDEAYAVLSGDWIANHGESGQFSPGNFRLNDLNADIAAI